MNDLPTIATLPPQQVDEDQATGLIPLTIDDAETAATALQVSVSSSNVTLVPSSNWELGGSGGNRTLRICAAQIDSVPPRSPSLSTDGEATAQRQFKLTVDAVDNDLPHLDHYRRSNDERRCRDQAAWGADK